MKVNTLGLIISQIIVTCGAERFQRGGAQSKGSLTGGEQELLIASESRYRSTGDYPHRDHSHYNDEPGRDDYNHRDDFDPPHFEPPHQWRHNRDNYNRRTFFQDYTYGTTTPFFQFMTSIFGGSDTPENYRYNRPTPSYPYEPPYVFRPTEPNYIPPPKPIRASVIKLESITRSPIYSSFGQEETTTKYYHNVGTLLNHVLIENSKNQQNFNYHQEDEVKIPPFKPLPVLPKPRFVPPTVTPPRDSFQYNRTGYKYPESVQDQLPHLHQDEVVIPYVSEKPIPQIFDHLPKEGRFHYFPSPDFSATTNILGLIDIRGLNLSNPIDITTIKSFPGAVEKVKRPIFKKKLSTHPDKLSVERVTNLTVEGYSNVGNENRNTQLDYLNVRDLIRYEMEKLSNVTKLPEVTNATKRPVNLHDELSLDAKILKDTNWDGLSVQQTTVAIEETTTQTAKPKPAFWEIVAAESTTPPTPDNTKFTITERFKPETTTQLFFTTDSNEIITTEHTTTENASQRRSNNQVIPVTEEPETLEVTTVQERTLRRRYSRRPKVVSFTPYPTPEELQKRLTNRNHFPKRQKPNITLAFGNKNVLKNIQNFGKDEVMKFSDEDVRKRRKTGKRRQLYKRVRTSSSERTIREDLL